MSPDPSAPLPPEPRPASALAPSTAQRERVVQALCVHFANDHISTEELESRLDRAYKAESLAQLDTLLSDLPVLSREVPGGAGNVAPASAPRSAPPTMQQVPARGVLMAVLGGVERKGSWLVPRHLKVIAVMGGAHLDLRNAVLSPEGTEIEVFALMGGAEIIVPPDVRLENLGTAFMGGFGMKASDVPPSPTGPVVRVTGFTMMGGVDMRYLTTDEEREARRQARVERANRRAIERHRR
jgi:hypothetical protein